MRELSRIVLAIAVATTVTSSRAADFKTGDMVDRDSWQKAEGLLPLLHGAAQHPHIEALQPRRVLAAEDDMVEAEDREGRHGASESGVDDLSRPRPPGCFAGRHAIMRPGSAKIVGSGVRRDPFGA